jgi:hypothetical protein
MKVCRLAHQEDLKSCSLLRQETTGAASKNALRITVVVKRSLNSNYSTMLSLAWLSLSTTSATTPF